MATEAESDHSPNAWRVLAILFLLGSLLFTLFDTTWDYLSKFGLTIEPIIQGQVAFRWVLSRLPRSCIDGAILGLIGCYVVMRRVKNKGGKR